MDARKRGSGYPNTVQEVSPVQILLLIARHSNLVSRQLLGQTVTTAPPRTNTGGVRRVAGSLRRLIEVPGQVVDDRANLGFIRHSAAIDHGSDLVLPALTAHSESGEY